MPIMYIRLEGVTQSYGFEDSWADRGTASAPTKSAIMGMLGAALGYECGSPEIADLNNSLKMSVRNNKEDFSYMTDLQIIRAYRVPDLPEMQPPFYKKLQNIKRADGSAETTLPSKYKKHYEKWLGTAGKLRDKTYLTNSSFTVFLEGEQDLLKKICTAFLNPVYPLYLGRKSCIPSRPIVGFMADTDNIQTAWKTCDVDVPNLCTVEYEADDNLTEFGIECFTRKDNVGENYQYTSRTIYRKKVQTCI